MQNIEIRSREFKIIFILTLLSQKKLTMRDGLCIMHAYLLIPSKMVEETWDKLFVIRV